jgi:hypothetical protein
VAKVQPAPRLSKNAPLTESEREGIRVAVIVSCIMAVTATLLVAQGRSKRCTQQDATRAEREASTLRTWPQVYRSYKTFSHCDDGAISQGYSDSVARLLSIDWRAAAQLNRLVSSDHGFERFVLKHVDDLMSPGTAQKILSNVESRCPSDATRLCAAIADRLRR